MKKSDIEIASQTLELKKVKQVTLRRKYRNPSWMKWKITVATLQRYPKQLIDEEKVKEKAILILVTAISSYKKRDIGKTTVVYRSFALGLNKIGKKAICPPCGEPSLRSRASGLERGSLPEEDMPEVLPMDKIYPSFLPETFMPSRSAHNMISALGLDN